MSVNNVGYGKLIVEGVYSEDFTQAQWGGWVNAQPTVSTYGYVKLGVVCNPNSGAGEAAAYLNETWNVWDGTGWQGQWHTSPMGSWAVSGVCPKSLAQGINPGFSTNGFGLQCSAVSLNCTYVMKLQLTVHAASFANDVDAYACLDFWMATGTCSAVFDSNAITSVSQINFS